MTTATDALKIARESTEPRRLAVDIVYAMPADPSEDELAGFRRVAHLTAFYAELRRMVAGQETQHDIDQPAA